MTRSELYVSDRIGRVLEVPTPPGRAFVGQAKHTHWVILWPCAPQTAYGEDGARGRGS